MTTKYSHNCEGCGAPSHTIPLDGGGYVVAYNCTAEFVVSRLGAEKTIIKKCPEPVSTRREIA